MKKEILNINHKSFSRYGRIIEFTQGYKEEFEIIASEPNYGWRLAVFRISRRYTDVLENHPLSMESFEPLKGVAILLVAENKGPENYEAFLLDKPVCLHAGVWHQIITISEEAQVKISENIEVISEFYQLNNKLNIQLAQMRAYTEEV